MPDPALEHRAKSLLDSLARTPRFAGSGEEKKARDVCQTELEGAGFSCREIPFVSSRWPGRWGPPLVAAAQAATIVMVSRIADQRGALTAIAVAAVMITLLVVLTARAKRGWIQNLGLQRATAANLEAIRGVPRV